MKFFLLPEQHSKGASAPFQMRCTSETGRKHCRAGEADDDIAALPPRGILPVHWKETSK